MIARMWPVDAVVGENGAFYFYYKNKKMNRFFFKTQEERKSDQDKLKSIEQEILTRIPEAAISSDQFCRISDLAIDFCEDVFPLDEVKINQIVEIFQKFGATAKISSIHVNGWFGDFTKLSASSHLLRSVFQLSDSDILKYCAFVGDSLNDEPMFEFFENSFGVANIIKCYDKLIFKPKYITKKEAGFGFAELTHHLISLKK